MKMPDVKEASPQVGLMGAGMSFATSSALKDIVNTAGLGDKEQLQVILAVLSGLIGSAAAIVAKLNNDESGDPSEPSHIVLQWLKNMVDTGQQPSQH